MWQNQPPLPPGIANAAVLGRDGEVRRGDELAAGGRGEAVHAGNNGLRNGLQGRHELRAEREQLAHRGKVGLDHVAEVVTGAEDGPIGGEQQTAGVTGSNLARGGQQLAHVLEREGVTTLRDVHCHSREVALALDAYERPGRPRRGWRHGRIARNRRHRPRVRPQCSSRQRPHH